MYDEHGFHRVVPDEWPGWFQRANGRPWGTQPWGDDPPPAPSDASEEDFELIALAWKSWAHFRPLYVFHNGLARAEVDLKGNTFDGYGVGSSDAAAAWAALQDCIRGWREYVFPAEIHWSEERRARGRELIARREAIHRQLRLEAGP